ncbi:MAG: ATP-binding protein [Nanoarchaeota archaeon]|nr:ATP-binding protein [Nanoarchaeota archaeon]
MSEVEKIAQMYGKSDVYECKILIFGDIKTFDFLTIKHDEHGSILAQVKNIIRDDDKLIGDVKIVGFKENGVLKNIRTPFSNEALIEVASDKEIEEIIGLFKDESSCLGKLEHHPNLNISLDLKKVITKHIAVLAKSGAGKSYTVGVILEEIIRKKIPILILDPHNEYSTLKFPNTDKKDMKRLEAFNLQPKGFMNQIVQYSPDTKINSQCHPITLDLNKMKPQDLVESLPQKITPAQQSLVYNMLQSANNRVDFDELIFNLSNEESNSKWSLISLIEQLKQLKLYSTNPTPLNSVIKQAQASIISLKGVEPYVQETFVAGLLRDLFEARKREEIPPFFLVLEEAHNFCPEASLGKLKSSSIIRTLAGEGRKFGIGLCVISQRPAKIDKNVISQCSTQILLKITNPNDLKSVIASSEGVDSASEQEIQRLNIGTCLLTGVLDIPLKVNVRPRMSKHGGETVDITLPYDSPEIQTMSPTPNNSTFSNNNGNSNNNQEEEKGTTSKTNSSNSSNSSSKKTQTHRDFIEHVRAEISFDDAKALHNGKEIQTDLIPGILVKIQNSKGEEFQVLVELLEGNTIQSIVPFQGIPLPLNLATLTHSEKELLSQIMSVKEQFTSAELLLNSKMMYTEITRTCESLAQKKIIEKTNSGFSKTNLVHFSNIKNIQFLAQQQFEEIDYTTVHTAKLQVEEIRKVLELFGTIKSMKEIKIAYYVQK